MNYDITKKQTKPFLTQEQAKHLKTIVTNSFSDLATYLEQKQEEIRQLQREHTQFIDAKFEELKNKLRLIQ